MTYASRISAVHPGEHIKNKVLPKGLSVKKAAELLGVGRPALSNLLNGKAALTPEMAMRVEKGFGANAQELLALQTAYDEFQSREQAKEMAVRTYVPTFLGIQARQISAWAADQIRARDELPALLRRLVHTTGNSLSKVDFPAYDNAQRHGWDGFVTSDVATPWIPRGDSGWEFGCNQDPDRKAESDFAARTASVSAEERKSITFVFVTPRDWSGKENWAKTKRGSGMWKDVRAYDASDLEQWLEQSIATQAWFGEVIGNGAEGVMTLQACWTEWASASEPPLSKILFRGSVAATKSKLQTWLTQPPGTPFVITADSEGEALAFVACALEELGAIPGTFYERALVLKTVEALKRTTALASDFLAIVSSPDVEAASASIQTTHHLLIVRRHSAVSGEPNIALDLVDDQTYREALAAMRLPEPDYQRYARETANSPTILRRRLSKVPAIHNPAWAADMALARCLIPLNFAGSWDSETKSDREIMRCLANRDYADIEQTVAELRIAPDAPVWSIGKYRGVTSKIDVLFATHSLITKKDLDDFFTVAEIVLSEFDPAIDLPPDKQWAANIYGKTREHSSGLRLGICETLVLLAVHGDALFREWPGIDLQARVDTLVRALLLPLDGRTWSSQKSDLPRYAEAAPDVFLDILEQDLASAEPKVHALLQPAGSAFFGGCPRTGLLWALETLVWKPDRLLRVSLLLAKLAEIRVQDNWVNKPEGILAAIYRNWMPQTAASIDERNAAMETVCRRSPKVGWRLIIGQFGTDHGIGHYSARPHWRNDASGAGQPVETWNEVYRVADKARTLALAWPQHDAQTLADLVERLQAMPEVEQEQVWALIKTWAASEVSDASRHELRERVRKTAFTRHARIHGVAASVKDRAREAYTLLAPRDLVVRHLWLFAQHWVDESADELEDEDFDYHKREARVSALRKTALTEIWRNRGYDGLMQLCELGSAESAIGWHLADGVLAPAGLAAFLDRLVGQGAQPAEAKIDSLLSGFLNRLEPTTRHAAISALIKTYIAADEPAKVVRLLKCAPFRAEIWAYLEELPPAWQQRYWREAYVRWEGQDESEFNTLVDRLIEAERPRAAFHAVHMDFGKVETKRLIRLLRSVATSDAEPAGHFQLAQYEVSEAFKSLKKRPDITETELAQLEFMYVSALDHSEYGIPTLETALAKEPQLFAQLIGLLYRRNDDGEDPPEWTIANETHRRNAATTAYSVLGRIRRTPGTKVDGSIDPAALRKWIDAVRALGANYGRAAICDRVIGQVLGRCRADADGMWPCEPVRQVLDALASQDIADGMVVGRHNSRGAHFRSPDGNDERDLAAQYRVWAKTIAFQYPFTAKLLEEMVRSYDREAVWHDTEANVRKRLSF
jgi:addiction module HigA family antidote